MRFQAVHQFSMCMYSGDGISNSVFFTQKLLHALGMKSEIYAGTIDPALENRVRFYTDYLPSPTQLLLIHHGVGCGYEDWFFHLPDKKSMVYHNISPARFFDSAVMHKLIDIGRTQLVTWQKQITSAIAVSEYNRQELLAVGYEDSRVRTIPLLVDLEKITTQPFNEEIVEENRHEFTILFVGNALPHKCQKDLVDCLYYFLQMIDWPARLILVGGGAATYCRALQRYIVRRGVHQYVHLAGKVSDRDLYGWYRAADVYLSMSEHEGFGMPLVEAGVFDTPVVAFDAAGIGDTLGQGGLLLGRKDPKRVAALLAILASDERLRDQICRTQRENLARFRADLLQQQLADFIAHVA